MNNKEYLTIGSTWFAKLPGMKTVSTVIVRGVSPKTVLFDNLLSKFGIEAEELRYLISEIKWIECVNYVPPTSSVITPTVEMIE